MDEDNSTTIHTEVSAPALRRTNPTLPLLYANAAST